MDNTEGNVTARIRAAREGSAEMLSALLESFRNYLRLLARTSLDLDLQSKVDESDVVQETLIKANARFGQFRGTTEREFAGWLRQILANGIADVGRRFRGAAAREVFRERSLDASSKNLGQFVAARIATPSEMAEQREFGVILADALALLSEDHREVIVLRNLEGRDWNDVAQRMGRGYDAVRMLWTRALEALRPRIEERL